MAIQQVNVYRFLVNLKSRKATGEHLGVQVVAIGATPQIAQQVVQQAFAGDLTGIMSAPKIVDGAAGAFTTMTGS